MERIVRLLRSSIEVAPWPADPGILPPKGHLQRGAVSVQPGSGRRALEASAEGRSAEDETALEGAGEDRLALVGYLNAEEREEGGVDFAERRGPTPGTRKSLA